MPAGMWTDYLHQVDLVSVIVNPSFGTGTPQQINNVCRGVATIREAAVSRGAVQAGDTTFLISELEMGDSKPDIGANIRPEDEGAETWYTVLWTVKDRDSRTWTCIARNLAIALDLGDLATQERRSESTGPDGSSIFTWTEVASDLPTRVQPMSAMMKKEYGAEEVKQAHILYFTNTLQTDEKDRFIVDGRYFYVRGWKNPETLGHPFQVIAEEGADGGTPLRAYSGGSGSPRGGGVRRKSRSRKRVSRTSGKSVRRRSSRNKH